LPGHDLNPWPGPRYGQGTPRYPRGDRPSRCGDRHGGPAADPRRGRQERTQRPASLGALRLMLAEVAQVTTAG